MNAQIILWTDRELKTAGFNIGLTGVQRYANKY